VRSTNASLHFARWWAFATALVIGRAASAADDVDVPAPRAVAGPDRIMELLQTPIVRNEMAFTEKQQQAIDALDARRLERYKTKLNWEAPEAEKVAFYTGHHAFQDETFLAIETLLTPAQKKRLDELIFQAYFPYTFCWWHEFRMPEFLEFSEQQKADLKRICDASLDSSCPLYSTGEPRERDIWRRKRKAERIAAAKILAPLTAGQIQRLKQREGEQIALAELQDQLWSVFVREIRVTGGWRQDPRPETKPRDLATGRTIFSDPSASPAAPPAAPRLARPLAIPDALPGEHKEALNPTRNKR
jgi:hypothetical protein